MITGSRSRVIIISAAVVLVSLLYFFVDARITGIFPKCPFYVITGLLCPGCGSQRAISSLLHLDIVAAFRFNMMLVISLPLFGYSAYVAVVNSFTSRRIKQRLFYSVWFIRFIAIAVIVFWITRNLPFYPFTLMAPHQH